MTKSILSKKTEIRDTSLNGKGTFAIEDDSDVLQGCVWRINLKDVFKIEILNYDGYRYGSVNYIRSNGKRFNWTEDFYKKL